MNEDERIKYFQNLIKNDEVSMIYRNMQNPFSKEKTKEIKQNEHARELRILIEHVRKTKERANEIFSFYERRLTYLMKNLEK